MDNLEPAVLPPSMPPAIPTAPPPPPPGPAPLPRRGGVWKIVLIIVLSCLLALSFVVNLVLGVMLAASIGEEQLSSTVLQKGDRNQTVAVYTVSGLIDEEAVANFVQFYQLLRNQSHIKAVVIRVDSPGGGVAASDEIHAMVQAIRDEQHLPVVVSMGGLAASGGYYISAGADCIYAEHTTVTGSIGVIAAWPVLKGMLDKIGVDMVTMRSTDAQRWKARENYWEEPDARIRQEMRQLLDDMQARFNTIVKDGRGDRLHTRTLKVTVPDANGKEVPFEETEPFNGKVYVATEAKKLGLVDEIGYLMDAAQEAGRLAKLSKPRIAQYTRRKGLREALLNSSGEGRLDEKALDKLTSCRVMLLWKP